jgi:hypothetical protein
VSVLEFTNKCSTNPDPATREEAAAETGPTPSYPDDRGSRAWDVLGLLALAAALVSLEARQPYYFTQDDALVVEAPWRLVGCRSLWQGQFPEYNPYNMFGEPMASTGCGSFTYPPTYMAYAAARHLLGNEYLVGDVFVVLHLVAGFAAMRWFCGELGLRKATANLAGLSFVLSGSFLIMGRSWISFVPTVVWLPVLGWGVLRLDRGPVGWGWILTMGLTIGLAFHVGFPQNPAFGCGFFVAAVVYLAMVRPWPIRRVLTAVSALLVGAATALPLLYVQYRWMRGTDRSMAPDAGIGDLLPGMILPYPLFRGYHPCGWGTPDHETIGGSLVFFGGLFAFLALVDGVALILTRPRRRDAWAGRVWLVCAVLACWLALGDGNLLWTLGKRVPIAGNLFRYPFRLLPFVVFFTVVAGALTLDRFLEGARRRTAWETGITLAALAVLGSHVGHATASFYSYGFRPYPMLPAAMGPVRSDAATGKARLLASYYDRSTDRDYGLALGHELPSVYGLPAFHGYNPLLDSHELYRSVLVALRKSPRESARAYGIGWFVISTDRPPILCGNPFAHGMELYSKFRPICRSLAGDLTPVADTGAVRLARLPDVAPLAFNGRRPDCPLAIRYRGDGLDVDVSSSRRGDLITVNFLCYPDIRLYADGKPIACRPDHWLRITTVLPDAAKVLAVRYESPWGTGVLISLGPLGAAVVVARLAREPGRPPFVS